jgi:chromate transport protein ChrA
MKARNLAIGAIFVGPAAAMLDLVLSYYLVYPSQALEAKWPLHVASIVAAVMAAAGIVAARRVLAKKDETAKVDEFLAVAGIALNAFSLLLVVGFAIPKFILGVHD